MKLKFPRRSKFKPISRRNLLPTDLLEIKLRNTPPRHQVLGINNFAIEDVFFNFSLFVLFMNTKQTFQNKTG